MGRSNGAGGCRGFSLCARSLSHQQACQVAIAAGNKRNNLKDLKKKKLSKFVLQNFILINSQPTGLVCAGLFPVTLQLVVVVYEVKTWLKQLSAAWVQSGSGWIRFLSSPFSVSEADLLAGSLLPNPACQWDPLSAAAALGPADGSWRVALAHQDGLSLRTVPWQQYPPAQPVFLPSQGEYFLLFPPNPAVL